MQKIKHFSNSNLLEQQQKHEIACKNENESTAKRILERLAIQTSSSFVKF